MLLYPGNPGNSGPPGFTGKWGSGLGAPHKGLRNLMRSANAKVYNCCKRNCSKGCVGVVAPVGGVDVGGGINEANGGGGGTGGGGGGELLEV